MPTTLNIGNVGGDVHNTDTIIQGDVYDLRSNSQPNTTQEPGLDINNLNLRGQNTVVLPTQNQGTGLGAKEMKEVQLALQAPPGFLYSIKSGMVYILNNDELFPVHLKRTGSQFDIEALKNFFGGRLGWRDVFVDRNMKAKEMEDWLEQIANRNYSDYSALFVIIMSHGKKKGVCGVDTEIVNVENYFPKFTENATLEGKPKIFILQACRGQYDDPGCSIETDAITQEEPNLINIPKFSDFLVCYPCARDYTALRDRYHGTLYIQTLVRMLTLFYDKEHILDILMRVNFIVAHTVNDMTIKTMPCLDVRMRCKVYFNAFFWHMHRKLKEQNKVPTENAEEE